MVNLLFNYFDFFNGNSLKKQKKSIKEFKLKSPFLFRKVLSFQRILGLKFGRVYKGFRQNRGIVQGR